MKTNFLKFTIMLFLAALLYACTDEQLKPEDNKETEATEGILATKNKLDKIFLQFGAALEKNEKTFSGGRSAATETWGSCATSTYTENPDGSWVIKVNYDGCWMNDEYKKGIVTLYGKSHSDLSGWYKVEFENFLEAKTEEEVETSGLLSGYYESSWTGEIIPLEDTTDIRRNDVIKTSLEVKYKNGSKDTFAATGELSSTMEGSEVNKYAFSGSTAKGDVFSGNVVKQLRLVFGCTESSIYVEGTEAIVVNGKSSVIDYGDGACDNIYTITTDGVVVTVDLDEGN